MSDDNDLPGVDKPAEAIAETARFGQGLVELAKAGGEWASGVLGTLPHDAVGILADQVRVFRVERAYKLREQMLQRLRARGYDKPEALTPPPSLLLPILEAAVDEDRDDLQILWEKLLASASDPARRNRVRKSFINIVRDLDPTDALVLQAAPGWTLRFDWVAFASSSLSISQVEVRVSVERLKEMHLIKGSGGATRGGGTESSGYGLSDLAILFLNAVED